MHKEKANGHGIVTGNLLMGETQWIPYWWSSARGWRRRSAELLKWRICNELHYECCLSAIHAMNAKTQNEFKPKRLQKFFPFFSLCPSNYYWVQLSWPADFAIGDHIVIIIIIIIFSATQPTTSLHFSILLALCIICIYDITQVAFKKGKVQWWFLYYYYSLCGSIPAATLAPMPLSTLLSFHDLPLDHSFFSSSTPFLLSYSIYSFAPKLGYIQIPNG